MNVDTAPQTEQQRQPLTLLGETPLNAPPSRTSQVKRELRSTALMLRDDGKIVEAHPGCVDLLGWQPRELLGKTIGKLFAKEACWVVEPLLKVPDSDEGPESTLREPVEVVATRKDLTTFPAQVRARRCAALNCWTLVISSFELTNELPAATAEVKTEVPVSTPSQASPGPELKPAAEPPTETIAIGANASPEAEPPRAADNNRELLVGRIVAAETELHLMRSKLEREGKKRKSLEKKLEEITTAKAEPEKVQTQPCASNESELKNAIKPGNESAALAPQTDLTETEPRLRESVAALAQVTAELERERGQRRRSDERAAALTAQLQTLHQELGTHVQSQQVDQKRISELQEQLRKDEESLNHSLAAMQKARSDRELAEDQLQSLGDLSARLEATLGVIDETKEAFKRAEEQMESRLQAGAEALKECEAKLQKELGERQRLEEALAKAQQDLQEAAAQHRLELSKLELTPREKELERHASDGDELRACYAAIKWKRENLALVNSLRQQMGLRLGELHRSTCRLLQAEPPEATKQELRSVLENILSLQLSLQTAGTTSISPDGSQHELQPDTKPL